MANRLAQLSEIDHAVLTTLEPLDIEVAGIAQEHLEKLASEAGSIRVQCPGCSAAQVLDDQLLGTEVLCASCQQTFTADWGEPVMTLPPASNDLTGTSDDTDESQQKVDGSVE